MQTAMNRSATIGMVSVILGLAGCSKSPPKPSEQELLKQLGYTSTQPTSPSQGPAATQPATLHGTAVLKGRVTFEGSRPPPRKLSMTGDSVCAKTGGVPDPARMIAADGGVPHVFVYIKQGISGKYTAPGTPVVLDQKGCMYEPHVFGIQVGQTLRITNSDPTAHNIHGLPTKNTPFNFSQPAAGMVQDTTFAREEIMVKVKCDVHGWMSAFAGVVTHPFFDVTDADGNFEIVALPARAYTVEIWHETFQRQTRTVTIKDGETVTLDFVYSKGARP